MPMARLRRSRGHRRRRLWHYEVSKHASLCREEISKTEHSVTWAAGCCTRDYGIQRMRKLFPKTVRLGSAVHFMVIPCQGSSPSPTASAKPNNRGVGKLMIVYYVSISIYK